MLPFLPLLLLPPVVAVKVPQAPVDPTRAFLVDLMAHFAKSPARIKVANQVLRLHGTPLSATQPSPSDLQALRLLGERGMKVPVTDLTGIALVGLAHELAPHDPGIALGLLERVATRPPEPDFTPMFGVALLACGKEGETFALRLLLEPDSKWKKFATSHLREWITFTPTGEGLLGRLSTASPKDAESGWLYPLAILGHYPSLPVVARHMHMATKDEVQAAAIWTYTELAGRPGLSTLEALRPIGPESTKEHRAALEWLRKETTEDNPHGWDVGNDDGFISRFASLRTPSMDWLRKEGMLTEEAVRMPRRLSSAATTNLIEQLIQSQGFGLEACKGSLFLSVSADHEAALTRLATINWWFPDRSYSHKRAKSIVLLLRVLRLRNPRPTP